MGCGQLVAMGHACAIGYGHYGVLTVAASRVPCCGPCALSLCVTGLVMGYRLWRGYGLRAVGDGRWAMGDGYGLWARVGYGLRACALGFGLWAYSELRALA